MWYNRYDDSFEKCHPVSEGIDSETRAKKGDAFVKKFFFISLVLLVLVLLIVSVSKCIKTIKELDPFDTPEISETFGSEKSNDLEYSSSLQIEDFTVKVQGGKLAYDEEEGIIYFKDGNGNDFTTFLFNGAVVKRMIISESDDEHTFPKETRKINVPKSWNGMEVKSVLIIIDSEECVKTEMLLKRSQN